MLHTIYHKSYITCGAVAEVHFSEVKPKQQYRYAFVRYFKEEHADEAIKTYNNWLLGKFRVKVENGYKKGIKPTVTRVFGQPKSNIPFDSRPPPEGVGRTLEEHIAFYISNKKLGKVNIVWNEYSCFCAD